MPFCQPVLITLLILCCEISGWPCGDKNISSYNTCYCGEQRIRASVYERNHSWCCRESGSVCGHVYSGSDYKCSQAELIPWSSACYGECLPQFLCSHRGKCLTKENIGCHGDDCEAGAPLCSQEDSPIKNYTTSAACGLTPNNHYELYKIGDRNNQQYDCLSRSDEDLGREDIFDNSKPCISWNSTEVCQSQISHNCKIFNNDLLIAQGELCVGRQKHCYYQQHQRFDLVVLNNNHYPRQCADNSHLIFQVNTKCNSRALFQIYHQLFCVGNIKVQRGTMCKEKDFLSIYNPAECHKEIIRK